MTNYYAVLGVKPTATTNEIKQAFRERAKHAHPDAGGSAEAMQRLNEAHRILADPASRRDYDRRRAETQNQASPQPARHPQSPAPSGAGEAAAAHEIARDHHRLRIRQARSSAWYILRTSALLAIALLIVTRFFATQVSIPSAKLVFTLITFVPMYGLVLGSVFLISPQIRLDLHDFIAYRTRHAPNPRLTQSERLTLLALCLAWVPLCAGWIMLFSGA